jgi:golgi-specific brefeldin A-resistance guanine nucleotide exchange factor 1
LNFYKIKEHKSKHLVAAELFNGKYKSGIEYLETSKLVSSPPKPSEITNFMKKYSKWISKGSISTILKADITILEEYMNSFDFKNMGIDQALRYIIFSFHLTGEGQQIERITRFFAKKYYSDNKETQNLFEDDEAAWVYACAVLMLNSDLHNPSNVVRSFFFSLTKNKMSLAQWITNTEASVNFHTKKLIPSDELERVYNEMLVRKFEFETTHKDDFKENSLWENVLERSQAYIKSFPHIYDENSLYHLDSFMFQQIYGKFISAITVGIFSLYLFLVFETTEDFENIESLKQGFVDCSKIAAQYKLSDVFDNLVVRFVSLLNSRFLCVNSQIHYHHTVRTQSPNLERTKKHKLHHKQFSVSQEITETI